MDREEEIRRLGYHLWEQEGRPEGRALQHWLAAEEQWNREHASLSSSEPPKPRADRGRRARREFRPPIDVD